MNGIRPPELHNALLTLSKDRKLKGNLNIDWVLGVLQIRFV